MAMSNDTRISTLLAEQGRRMGKAVAECMDEAAEEQDLAHGVLRKCIRETLAEVKALRVRVAALEAWGGTDLSAWAARQQPLEAAG